MPTIQELREKRANVWSHMTEVMESEWTGESRAKYDAAEAECDALEAQIAAMEKHEERAKQMAVDTTPKVDRSQVPAPREPETGKPDQEQQQRYAEVFTKFCRSGRDDLDADERRDLMNARVELRAAGVGTNTAGGYLVPAGYREQMVQTMKTFGGMLEEAEVIHTSTGANLQWPTNDDTANVGAILAENTQITEQDVTVGTNSIDAYMYTSKLVRVSFQLLQDSAFDFESWLRQRLGERIGRILNQHFTTGTGTSQPDGIVTGAPVGKQGAAGQTTTVTYDDLIDLIDSLDPAYQQGAKFMLSQNARKSVRKLKDTTNQPLWQPSIQAGMPDQLLGYGYVLNQDLPVPAASAKSILFGNFRQAYLVRLVTDLSLLRLSERYADFLQVAFAMYQRADGTLQNANAVRAYQNSAT